MRAAGRFSWEFLVGFHRDGSKRVPCVLCEAAVIKERERDAAWGGVYRSETMLSASKACKPVMQIINIIIDARKAAPCSLFRFIRLPLTDGGCLVIRSKSIIRPRVDDCCLRRQGRRNRQAPSESIESNWLSHDERRNFACTFRHYRTLYNRTRQ